MRKLFATHPPLDHANKTCAFFQNFKTFLVDESDDFPKNHHKSFVSFIFKIKFFKALILTNLCERGTEGLGQSPQELCFPGLSYLLGFLSLDSKVFKVKLLFTHA